MIASFPNNTRETIEAIINEDGRPVTFYVVDTVTGCPVCSLDPITNTSTDSYCPVCSGEYWIYTYSGWIVTAHVTWGRADDRAWETGGMIDNGEVSVKFMHTDEAEQIVHSAHYAIVDDREVDLEKIIPRGVPEINRIIVLMKEKENQNV